MRIALHGADLAAARFEGPAVYVGELYPHLTRLLSERGHDVSVYLPGPLEGVTVRGTVRVIQGGSFWTQRTFGPAVWREKPDLLFIPKHMLPLLRPRGTRSVCVVHDLEFLRYPATYTAKNRLLLRLFTRQVARRATRLIAVSSYTRDGIVAQYGRSPADIAVVHHGVDHRLFRAALMPGDAAARARLGVPAFYLLYVGALQPRKNVAGLLEAFAVVGREEPNLHLVLASGGWWKSQEIRRRITASPLASRVRQLVRVPREDLPVLYRGAACFVLPSFSEGFGLPVLEAMACGVPVVTSATSALPEVAGGAALLVNPGDSAALASAIRRVLRETTLRAALVARGKERAEVFSWEKAAEQTARVIEEAGGFR